MVKPFAVPYTEMNGKWCKSVIVLAPAYTFCLVCLVSFFFGCVCVCVSVCECMYVHSQIYSPCFTL